MTDFKVGDKVLLPRKHPNQSIESRICEVVSDPVGLPTVYVRQGHSVFAYVKQYLVKYEGKEDANSSK